MLAVINNNTFKQYFTEHSKDAKKVWEGIRCAIEWHKSKIIQLNLLLIQRVALLPIPNQLHVPLRTTLKKFPTSVLVSSHKTSLMIVIVNIYTTLTPPVCFYLIPILREVYQILLISQIK